MVKTITINVLLSIVTVTAVYWIVTSQQKKIGVVDAVKLFDQFNMKKELESREKVKLEEFKKKLDSVGTQVKLAHAAHSDDQEKSLMNVYNEVGRQLEIEFKRGNKEINEQVWKRLNPLMEEYGRMNKLHLIIGANGMGSVLFNDEYYDLTGDVVNYANKKYEGGN